MSNYYLTNNTRSQLVPPRWQPPSGILNSPTLFGSGGFTGMSNDPPAKAPAKPFDYASMIASDPLLMQEKADLSAEGIQSATERQAATQRALINFGDIPDFSSAIGGLGLDPNSPMYRMLFGDVNEMTRKAAQDMTNSHLSTNWNLQHAHESNLNDLIDKLAARGSFRSGAAISGVGQENQNYTGAQFNARRDLLDYLTGVQSAFTQSEQARQAKLAGYMSDATNRQIAEHPYVPGQADAPPAPPAPPSASLAPSPPLAPPPAAYAGLPPSSPYGTATGPYIGTMPPAPPPPPPPPSAPPSAAYAGLAPPPAPHPLGSLVNRLNFLR